MSRKNIIKSLIVIFSISILLTGCNHAKEVEVDLTEKVLCPASSVTDFVDNGFILSFDIPPNAGITKIYVSIGQDTPIDSAVLRITSSSETIFLHLISKDPTTEIGEFETTLVQPLCVSADGATATIITANNNVATVAKVIAATVVYCPDYCNQ